MVNNKTFQLQGIAVNDYGFLMATIHLHHHLYVNYVETKSFTFVKISNSLDLRSFTLKTGYSVKITDRITAGDFVKTQKMILIK